MVTAKQNTVSLRLNPALNKPDNLHAYVVDHAGKITETAPFKGGEASLKAGQSVVQGQSKVYVAPQIPAQLAHKANERMLIKAGAQPVQKNMVNPNVIDIHHLPPGVLQPWNGGTCIIQGNITNTVTIDGKEVTNPLCHARVHIVEVEVELALPRIPISSHIPDSVIREIQTLLPKPPKPDPIGPVAAGIVPSLAKNLTLNAGAISSAISVAKVASTPQAALLAQAAALHIPTPAHLPQIPDHVLSALSAPSLDTARKALAENAALLHPYFCLWPQFWPWIYKWDEDHVVSTDNNGHFQFADPTFDEPNGLNIYIWVEAQINGQWVTVYRPTLPCHTHWHYQCNTPINIGLRDGRIAPCDGQHIAGDVVWVKRIGNGTSVRNIALQAVDSHKPSLFSDARGLAPHNFVTAPAVQKWVSPFSWGFPIYVQFGDGFSAASPDATHFRWKYRRIADADLVPLNESFAPQEGPLGKPYTYQGTDAHGNAVFYTDVFQLDKTLTSGGKIYKIPNVEAKVDIPQHPTAKWDQDTVTINVDALHMQNGLYEYVLELCDSTGNVKHLPSTVFQLDTFAAAPLPASTPAETVDPQYIANNAQSYGFRFLLRIDNDHTSCGIYDAAVLNSDGTTATTDTQCGFAKYTGLPSADHVHLLFFGYQAHRYAEYAFSATRGNVHPPVVSTSNIQIPAPQLPPATVMEDHVLSDMLGPCPAAAFAEVLNVYAYHTDGTTRLYQYDSSAVAAIAVEPK